MNWKGGTEAFKSTLLLWVRNYFGKTEKSWSITTVGTGNIKIFKNMQWKSFPPAVFHFILTTVLPLFFHKIFSNWLLYYSWRLFWSRQLLNTSRKIWYSINSWKVLILIFSSSFTYLWEVMKKTQCKPIIVWNVWNQKLKAYPSSSSCSSVFIVTSSFSIFTNSSSFSFLTQTWLSSLMF